MTPAILKNKNQNGGVQNLRFPYLVIEIKIKIEYNK